MNLETTSCDLCGKVDYVIFYAGAEWKQPVPNGIMLVLCQRCGLIYLNPRPSQDAIGAFYGEDYPPYRPAIEDERFIVMRWMRRRKLVQRRKMVEYYSRRKSGRILDVGCATGLFLHEMAQAGWQVAGVDPSLSAATYARTRFNLNVFQGTLEEAPYSPESFDVVTFWDVLEHTFSPTAELSRAVRLLKPGGLVAVSIPNWDSLERRLFGAHWIGFDPPRHLYVFTRSTLNVLLKKSGLRTLGWVCFMPSYYPFIISLERWLRSVSPLWAQRVSRWLNFPGVRFIFEPWFIVLNRLKCGGVISVFARKDGMEARCE